MLRISAVSVFVVLGCSESGVVLSTVERDSGGDGRADVGPVDAGPRDAAFGDATADAPATPDAGPVVDGGPDAGLDGGPDAGEPDAGPVPDAGPCEYHPTGTVDIEEEWHWFGDPDVVPTHAQVMMTPTVADVNADGVPDIVFNSFSMHFYYRNGVIRAISGRDGSRIWPTSDPGFRTTPSAEIAIADVDPSSPGPEIFTCSDAMSSTRPGHLIELAADGTLLRRYDTAPNLVPCGQDAPAIADMDGDGEAEIVVRYVIAHPDGTVAATIRDGTLDHGSRYTVLADVDDDPDLELLGGNGVFDWDGAPLWERVVDMPGRPAISSPHPAVADLDLDGDPELVLVAPFPHEAWIVDARTGDTIAGPVDVNPPELATEIGADAAMGRGGGIPMIANLDADPELEIGVSSGWSYAVFERDLTRRWWVRIWDLSSRQTGSSAFDFQGDGIAEAISRDEFRLRVLDADGAVEADACNSSGTLNELAVPVDVDADGDAEIVVSQTDYSVTCPERGAGIRVFGGPHREWVATRRIWNQHSYHVTNVADDATVPLRETMPWRVAGMNAFRENILLEGRFLAPDLVVQDLRLDESACRAIRLLARVANQGSAPAPAGIPVSLYEGTGVERRFVARSETTSTLAPGATEVLVFDLPAAGSTRSFTVVVNDPGEGSDEGVIAECRDANGSAGPIAVTCP